INEFDNKELDGVNNIQYELSNIRYNIGVAHYSIAETEPKDSESSIKRALDHYRCAADAFLRNCKSASDWPLYTISKETSKFLYLVMLGCAHCCCAKKAVLDELSPLTCAKIFAFISQSLVDAAYNLTSSDSIIIPSHVYESWIKWSHFYRSCFHSLALYCYALYLEDNEEIGKAVGYLQAAVNCMEDIKMNIPEYKYQAEQMMPIIMQKYSSMSTYNRITLSQSVPNVEQLTYIPSHQVVKPLYFLTQFDKFTAKKRDIFNNIMPLHAHQLSSLYSEEKANLLRRYITMVEDKNDQIGNVMSYLDSNDVALTYLANIDQIPDDLMECMIQFQNMKNYFENLLTSWKDLQSRAQQTQALFKTIQNSKHETETLHHELIQLSQSLTTAVNSNAVVETILKENVPNLYLLEYSKEALLEKLDDRAYLTDANKIKSDEFHKMLDKVKEMKDQRTQLIDDLRKQLQDDEIALSAFTKASPSEVFHDALSKHNETIGYLNQNLSAQDTIVSTITEVNAKFAPFHRLLLEAMQRRDKQVKSIIHSFELIPKISEKIKEGSYFFDQLYDKLRRIDQVIKSSTINNPYDVTPVGGATAQNNLSFRQSGPYFSSLPYKIQQADQRFSTPHDTAVSYHPNWPSSQVKSINNQPIQDNSSPLGFQGQSIMTRMRPLSTSSNECYTSNFATIYNATTTDKIRAAAIRADDMATTQPLTSQVSGSATPRYVSVFRNQTKPKTLANSPLLPNTTTLQSNDDYHHDFNRS
ncbi:hypothetical protein GJ496_005964, partial [Pomphorhynchus laevis]